MNILRQWQKLSVSGRISFGFATVLFLHVSIAAIGHYGLEKASTDRDKQASLRAQVESFYEIDRLVGEMQRHVLLFAHGGFKGPETRAIELQEKLAERLDQAKELASEQHQQALQHMEEHLATHQAIFADVVLDRAKRRELIDLHLNRSGTEFDLSLSMLIEREHLWETELNSLASSFRSAQLYAMKFVHSPDSSYVRNTQRYLAETKKQLQQLETVTANSQVAVAALIRLVDEYDDNFIQMVQATRGYLHLTNVVLAGESQELFFLANKVRSDYSLQAEALSVSMSVDSDRFSTASNLFSLLTIVLGVAASWIIQKSISPPLNKITDTFDGLAHGRKYDQIPGVERTDDLGRLAAAAQVFSEKAAETERLLEEVKWMREQERNHAHSQKLESLGQLAAGIAHEINTPLQCVASNVEFLEESYDMLTDVIDDCCSLLNDEMVDGIDQKSPVDTKELKETISSRRFGLMKSQAPEAASEAAEAVRRVVEIISAMKTLSHPGSTEHIPADINELIHNSATLSKHRWRDHAKLEFDLDADLPFVPVHQAEISQVLINLLVNAGDAVSEHTDRIGKITIRTKKLEDGVQIEVYDNGGGIPEAHLSKVFDPFFTTKEVGHGTGQGLALAYDVMVRRHAGKIDVQSSSQGTTFRLHLPLVPNVPKRLLQAAD